MTSSHDHWPRDHSLGHDPHGTPPDQPGDVEQLVRSYRTDPRPELLERIVRSCEWTVAIVAQRIRWHDESLDDLEQIARMAILAAIDRYDDTRGVAFGTFAESTMIGMLKHHHRDVLQPKVPRSAQARNAACRRAVERLTASLRRVPTCAEIAADVGFSESEVSDALAIDQLFHPLSLSSSVDDDVDVTLEECLGVDDRGLESTADRAEIHDALTALPSRQRTILFLHFYDGRTQAEIGARLGISQVQVSRLMAKGLAAMRHRVGDDRRTDAQRRSA